MIFEPAERFLLPTKDLLSYIFDDPPYDQDQPVSDWLEIKLYLTRHLINVVRSTLTSTTPPGRSLVIRHESSFVS